MKKKVDLISLIAGYKPAIGLNLFFNVLAAIFSLFTFAAIVPFLDILFKTGSSNPIKPEGEFTWSNDYILNYLSYELDTYIQTNGELQALGFFCGVIVVMSFLKNLFTYFSNFFMAYIRNGVVRDLRDTLYSRLIGLPLAYFSDEKKGDVISKMTSDVAEVEWGIIGSLEMIFKSPINFFLFLFTLFFMSWELTLIALVLLPTAGIIIARIAKNLKETASRGQKQLGIILSVVEETLGGMRILKAFNAQDHMKGRFREENNGYFRLMVSVFRRHHIASPFSEFFGTGVMVVLLWIGGGMVLGPDSPMDGKFFIGYLILFSQIISPAKAISDAWFRMAKARASLERMSSILDAENPIKNAPDAIEFSGLKEVISYEGVSFGYEDHKVIDDVSFSIMKGETVALVGPSGGGKSTSADLLARFYDVMEGGIKIDGTDLRQFNIASWRNQLGIVSQHSILFNDSVTNNIALGDPNPDPDRVRQAAEVAFADSFVKQLPEGYESNIGDGGNKLSGGQKQRLSIARAVYANPDILILDEATSALDTESEQLVQKALDELMQNRTSLVIAHRLSTIRKADKIVVIDKGVIRESGTHESLIAADGMYAKLVEMQKFD